MWGALGREMGRTLYLKRFLHGLIIKFNSSPQIYEVDTIILITLISELRYRGQSGKARIQSYLAPKPTLSTIVN